MSETSRKVLRAARDGDGYFSQPDIRLFYKAAAEIERMHLALSQIIDSDDLDFIKARAVAALPDT